MHLANYVVVTVAACVPSPDGAPSFRLINAVVGLLLQEEMQNVNWYQLLVLLLSLKLGLHLLCSCFPDLQLAGGTSSFSRCLERIPDIIQLLPCALVRLQLSEARLNSSLMLLVVM